jgi:hypothetical protein
VVAHGELCRELIDAGKSAWVAQGLLGTIHGFQGKLASARRMLVASLATSEPIGHYHMRIDSIASLAYVAGGRGRVRRGGRAGAQAARALGGLEDHHFAISGCSGRRASSPATATAPARTCAPRR